MCALTAGQRRRKVLLIDHEIDVGKKIMMSGGGSCNFTNLWVEADNYISNNPHFCKSALNCFTQYDFINMVEKHNIPYHERELGQLFCNGASKKIIDMLLEECKESGVKIQTKCTIEEIKQSEKETDNYNNFIVKTNFDEFITESLIVATGGLSIPAIGATGFGYEIAKQFGLKVIPCQPGLVSLIVDKSIFNDYSQLSGISFDASIFCNGKFFKGAVLFTHKGLSGPVILQISNYWNPGDEIEINLLPEIDLVEKIKQWQKENPKAEMKNLLGKLLPKRLSHYLLELLFYNKPVNQYNDDEIKNIAEIFHHWCIRPSGTEGYKKAEVTKGGVDSAELSSKTFEVKKVKGLYFIGEVLDVTGWLGGYNLQWAWSSGWCAG
ncbi:MAG: NAD(P)/FAD-dependent oxidoreductase, partial [Calditrichia bacterium]|nr:NAD(P)/FAD-dependent oxidoreductase [Calditrichia bacterium]